MINKEKTKTMELKITKGEVAAINATIVGNGAILGKFKNGQTREENAANAELCAEAFNVANETGLTPRELKDKLFDYMQYYMEYCMANGYVTPQEWSEKHRTF